MHYKNVGSVFGALAGQEASRMAGIFGKKGEGVRGLEKRCHCIEFTGGSNRLILKQPAMQTAVDTYAAKAAWLGQVV